MSKKHPDFIEMVLRSKLTDLEIDVKIDAKKFKMNFEHFDEEVEDDNGDPAKCTASVKLYQVKEDVVLVEFLREQGCPKFMASLWEQVYDQV